MLRYATLILPILAWQCMAREEYKLFPFTLHKVHDKEARCMDGSDLVVNQLNGKAFYYAGGYKEGAKKFIIMLQGGGWIGGRSDEEVLMSALEKSQVANPIITSQVLDETYYWQNGLFARDPEVNPHFYNWNVIDVSYCDGTGYQGYRKDPVEYKGKEFHFKGEKNFKAIIKHLLANFNLGNAETVLLYGCSAGGMSALYWVDQLRAKLGQSVVVLGVSDSGFILDDDPIDGNDGVSLRNFYFKRLMKIVNVEVKHPVRRCVDDYPWDGWKCMMAQYLLPYIETPLFFIQSQNDGWAIPYILHSSCYDFERPGRQPCSKDEAEAADRYIQAINDLLNEAIEKNPKWGAWITSVPEHCFYNHATFTDTPEYVTPDRDHVRYSLSDALHNWIQQRMQDLA